MFDRNKDAVISIKGDVLSAPGSAECKLWLLGVALS